jgi:hypothetical protein
VEERPFEGRVTKRQKQNNSTLPKAVAGEQSSQATGITIDLAVLDVGWATLATEWFFTPAPVNPA